jgi:hypothetical protein
MNCVGGLAQNAAVVRPRQPAIAGDDDHRDAIAAWADHPPQPFPAGGAADDQRRRRWRPARHQLAHLQRVRLGPDRALERLLKLRRRDHLHGLGDLADVADRLAAFDDCSGLGHGFSVPVFSDQNYLGVGVGFHPYEFHTGFPPVGSIGVGGVRGKPGEITTGIQSVVSIPQAIGSGSVQYILEMDRLDQTQFRFSAWSTSNVLLGTTVADMSMPRYPQDIPSNLYITLAGNGTWDDVTIVSVPESGIAGLVFGLGLTITCLRRTRVAVC